MTEESLESVLFDLYSISDSDEYNYNEKVRKLINISKDFLGTDNGHIERFDGDEHTIVENVGLSTDLIAKGKKR